VIIDSTVRAAIEDAWMEEIKTKCLQVAIEFIKEEFKSHPGGFKMTYEGINTETGQHLVHVVHQDYLNAEAPGGHDQSRELYISDEGIVVRALRWQ